MLILAEATTRVNDATHPLPDTIPNRLAHAEKLAVRMLPINI